MVVEVKSELSTISMALFFLHYSLLTLTQRVGDNVVFLGVIFYDWVDRLKESQSNPFGVYPG